MGSVGIKISQRGYDVTSCPDNKLLFNSEWPLLKISSSGTFSLAGSPSTIFTHNLGYTPAFIWYSDGKIGTTHTTGISTFGNTFNGYIIANSTTLSIPSGFGVLTLTGRYYIFALDIESAFQAPSIVLPTISDIEISGQESYGLKVAKPGKDIYSTDYRDYTIHSGSRSPMVHSVTPGSKSASPSTVTVAHNLGYSPIAFVYIKLTGETGYRQLTAASDSAVVVDNNNVMFSLAYECQYSIVILKDPLLLN